MYVLYLPEIAPVVFLATGGFALGGTFRGDFLVGDLGFLAGGTFLGGFDPLADLDADGRFPLLPLLLAEPIIYEMKKILKVINFYDICII